MKKETAIILRKLGVPPHFVGYDYIGEAVELIHADRSYLRGVVKVLYPAIAKKFGTTGARVERGIRYAIETAFRNLTPEQVAEIFGNNIICRNGKPVNTYFLAAVAELIEE